MSEQLKQLTVKIFQRYMPAADWKLLNPKLGRGEIGIEEDTNKFKFGNGTTLWSDLPYAVGSLGDYGLQAVALPDKTYTGANGTVSLPFALQDKLNRYAGVVIGTTDPDGIDYVNGKGYVNSLSTDKLYQGNNTLILDGNNTKG